MRTRNMMASRFRPWTLLILLTAVAQAAGACGDGGSGQTATPAPRVLEFRNPLLDAEPGEWVLLRLQGGNENYLEVMEVNPRTKVVTVLDQTREKGTGKLIASGPRVVSPNDFLFGFASSGAIVTRLSTETILVAGRSWECVCVETFGPNQGPVKHYFSEDAPVTGLVLQKKIEAPASTDPDLETGLYMVKGVETDIENARLIDWSGRDRTE